MHNFIRWGSRVLTRSSPTMLIATGAALALALPPVRKGLRSAAILTTRGFLNITDQIQHIGTTMKEELEDFVAEARESTTQPTDTLSEQFKRLKHGTRSQFRRIAVTVTGGALAASDQAKSLQNKFEEVVDAPQEEQLHSDIEVTTAGITLDVSDQAKSPQNKFKEVVDAPQEEQLHSDIEVTTAGITLDVSDQAKSAQDKFKEVVDAPQEEQLHSDIEVTAAGSSLEVSDQAKSPRKKFKGVVEPPQKGRMHSNAKKHNDREIHDGLDPA